MIRRRNFTSMLHIFGTLFVCASGIGGIAGCELIAAVDEPVTPDGKAGGAGTVGIGSSGGNAGAGGMGGNAGTAGTAGTGGMGGNAGGTAGAGGMGGNAGNGGTSCTPMDDGNDCTTDACDSNGTSVHIPVASGTVCANNGGFFCDVTAACVECLTVSDCPGMDNTCQTRSCTLGLCGLDYAPVDTVWPEQTVGDCKTKVCDGNGAQVEKTDDTDLPDDGNACTSDTCVIGTPSNTNVPQGTSCTAIGGMTPTVCNNQGQCIGCNGPNDCPGTDDECGMRTCSAGVCGRIYTSKGTVVAAQTANDCLSRVCDGMGNTVDIVDDLDAPLDDGNACTAEACSMGTPLHPNKANGVACNDGDLCTQTDTCIAGSCTGANPVVCPVPNQCRDAGVCNPSQGVCSNPAKKDGTSCNDNDICTQTDTCMAGSCVGATFLICPLPAECHVAGTCDPMNGCSNPVAADGTACTSNMVLGACSSGSCHACGDGMVSGTEWCDDGNTINGDGCSDVCHSEADAETEPNDSCGQASGPYLPPFVISGTIAPLADQDFIAVTVPNHADLKIQTFAPTLGVCSAGTDTVIELRGPNCTPILVTNDQGGIASCSLIDPATAPGARHLAPGTYFVQVHDYLNNTLIPAYLLHVTFTALCGNGVIEGSELCDGGAGCAADCTPLPICGNGVIQSGEQCDDGNTTSADGCNATCQWETVAEVENNDTIAAADTVTANNPLLLINGNRNITGNLPVSNNNFFNDYFKVSVTNANTVIRFETFDTTGHDCVGMANMTRLTLYSSSGAFLKQDGYSSGINNCSELSVLLQPGSYYIRVDNVSGFPVANYFLQASFHSSNGSEVEPNDGVAAATATPGFAKEIFGDHSLVTDEDWYSVTVPAMASLRMETIEGDDLETCESFEIDSTITLFDALGTPLATDDDSGRGYCSLVDGTGTSPVHSGASHLAAGTYYIRVTSFNNMAATYNQFKYRLVTVIR